MILTSGNKLHLVWNLSKFWHLTSKSSKISKTFFFFFQSRFRALPLLSFLSVILTWKHDFSVIRMVFQVQPGGRLSEKRTLTIHHPRCDWHECVIWCWDVCSFIYLSVHNNILSFINLINLFIGDKYALPPKKVKLKAEIQYIYSIYQHYEKVTKNVMYM